jgi:broad specificity phosphatase PhoE
MLRLGLFLLSLRGLTGEVVLGIFGHGGCIRAMLNHYVGIHDPLTWLVAQDNTALNELLIDAHGTRTIRINDTAHLKYTMTAPTWPNVKLDPPAEPDHCDSTCIQAPDASSASANKQ